MRKFTIRVTGVTELLMHNGRLVNPMDPATKEISEATRAWKKNATEENFLALARAEFLGGLYYHKQGDTVIGPFWPSENLHTSLKKAGAKVKRGRGTLKNPIAAAIIWDSQINPLTYAGAHPGAKVPREADELWQDESFRFVKAAKVGSAKIMRTRPKFREWGFEASGTLDTEILDVEDLQAAATIAGQLVGLGDWRPEKGGTYGRFAALVKDEGDYDPLKAALWLHLSPQVIGRAGGSFTTCSPQLRSAIPSRTRTWPRNWISTRRGTVT